MKARHLMFLATITHQNARKSFAMQWRRLLVELLSFSDLLLEGGRSRGAGLGGT